MSWNPPEVLIPPADWISRKSVVAVREQASRYLVCLCRNDLHCDHEIRFPQYFTRRNYQIERRGIQHWRAAKAKGRPSVLPVVLKPLDPKSVIGTLLPCPGMAFTVCPLLRSQVCPFSAEREIPPRLTQVSSQRTHGDRHCRSAPQSEIDSSRTLAQRSNRSATISGAWLAASPAAAHTNGFCRTRYMANQHGRCRASESGDGMMFGQPISP